MPTLLDQLAENLDAKLGPAKEVAAAIGNNQILFDEVFPGILSPNPLLQSRAVNVIEAVSRKYPHLLQCHKEEVWQLFRVGYEGISMKCNMPLLIGHLNWDAEELGVVIDVLEERLHTEPNKFAKVSCLQALADQADKHPWLRPEVVVLIKGQMEEGSAAFKARGRILLKKWE